MTQSRSIYLFLPQDMEALNALIAAQSEKVTDTGKFLGESCRQSAETTHDNFPYEQGIKDYAAAKNLLDDYLQVRNHAQQVIPEMQNLVVKIGNWVTVKENPTGKVLRYQIGSFRQYTSMNGKDPVASYASPRARAILGLRSGETSKLIHIGGKEVTLTVTSIELPG